MNEEPEDIEVSSGPTSVFPSYPNDTLEAAMARHKLEVPAGTLSALERYAHLLWSWNEKINLTRHTDWDRFVGRDLVDTMQLSALLLPNEEVLDLGSGGGVPGITLAIVRPDLSMTCAESIGKKSNVLKTIVKEMRLNVRVEARRGEKVLADERFDAVTARAVGPLIKLLNWVGPNWLSAGRLLAVKGPKWPDERGEARHRGLMNRLELRCAAEYPLYGTDSNSVILKIWPSGATEK